MNFLEKYKKQDVRVQIMRILACLIVIGCHVRLKPFHTGSLSKSILLVHGFMDDGVAIFFCITGFFLFQARSFKKLAQKTVFSVVIPALAIMFFSLLLLDWVKGQETFVSCILNFQFQPKAFLISILQLAPEKVELCGHLWYVKSHIEIVAAFPVLRLVANKNGGKTSRNALIWILALSGISLILSDLRSIYSPIGHINAIFVFSVPIFFILLGYILYKNKEKFKEKLVLRMGFLFGLVSITILRFVLLYYLLQKNSGNTHLSFWNSAFGGIFTVCFIGFFLTFPERKGKLAAIINFIASKTFTIYLMHVLIYTKLETSGIKDRIYQFSLRLKVPILSVVGYTIAYVILIFGVGLVISILLSLIKTVFFKLIAKIKLSRFAC